MGLALGACHHDVSNSDSALGGDGAGADLAFDGAKGDLSLDAGRDLAIDALVDVSADLPLTPFLTSTFRNGNEAPCPVGTVVIGGGVNCTGYLLETRPLSTISRSWRGACSNGATPKVAAYCLGGPGIGKVNVRQQPETRSEATATCLAGELAVGGGCDCGLKSMSKSLRSAADAWRCTCQSGPITAWVVCIDNATTLAFTPADEPGKTTTKCTTGRVVGGGCDGYGSLTSSGATSDPKQWQCARNTTNNRVQAMCSSLPWL